MVGEVVEIKLPSRRKSLYSHLRRLRLVKG